VNDLDVELETLTQLLTDHYRHEFSHATLPTITVSQKEVDILLKIIQIVGGKETHTIQATCWNTAREDYPAIFVATVPEFPFYRKGWLKRGDCGGTDDLFISEVKL